MTFADQVEPGHIIIKDPEILRAILERQYHPLVIQIQCDIAREYGCVITSAYRPNDSGVHGHMRGLDNRSWCYPPDKAQAIIRQINSRWGYDPQRPKLQCAQIHTARGGAEHIHLQVNPNTRRR